MSKFSLVVLASGQGTNFMAIQEAIEQGKIPAQIKALVVSRPSVAAAEKAEQLGVPVVCVDRVSEASKAEWDQKLLLALKSLEPDLIVLAGFLRKIGPLVIKEFSEKLINTHPSLLPAFGGEGMYGRKIHEAVMASKEKVTGITIHRVVSDYDSGPIIAQVALSVNPDGTPETLEDEVKSLEHEFLVNVLEKSIKAKLT
ncbi:MAG: phosphoribosylglycinamide formyltransferase [Bdellovibrionales bacterium]|nr:phosphoribosylglycinamide formyltransferase [Bdellovibrionales bacterium]